MPTEFWESLRLGFTQLRADCAIDPPIKPAGRLTAIWTAQPPPGEWQLSYWNGVDGYGVTRRFEWHAQRAATRLGFGETGQKAVWFWLDRIRGDAPDSHLRIQQFEGPGGTEQLFSVEILDICGLSAEYCIKCEADEMAALQAQVARAPSEETPAPPEQPAARSLVPDAALDRDGHSTDKVMEAPFFEYRYPEGFPDADQNAIENVRLEANRKISSNPWPSYDELSASRYAWVWELVSRAAPIFGRVAGVQQWSPNRRRDTLKDFAARAARAAPLSRPAFERLCDSPEWKTLDSALFPADSPNAVDNTSALDQPEAIPLGALGNSDPKQGSRKPTDVHAGGQDSPITPSPQGPERLIRDLDQVQAGSEEEVATAEPIPGPSAEESVLPIPGRRDAIRDAITKHHEGQKLRHDEIEKLIAGQYAVSREIAMKVLDVKPRQLRKLVAKGRWIKASWAPGGRKRFKLDETPDGMIIAASLRNLKGLKEENRSEDLNRIFPIRRR